MQPDPLSRTDLLLAMAVAVVWGVNFVVIRVGVDAYPALLLASLRFALVAAIGPWFVPRPDISWTWLGVIGFTIGVGQFGLLFVAIEMGMPAGLAAVVLQSQVMFTLLFAALIHRDFPTRTSMLGTAMAIVGLSILSLGANDAVPRGALLLTLAAGASWGLGNVATREAQAADGLAVIVWASLFPPVPLFALSLAIHGPGTTVNALLAPNVSVVASLVYLSVLATFFGFGTWSSLLTRYPASTVVPYALLVPPVGLASGWVLLNEQPSPASLAGSVLAVVGIAYPHLHQKIGTT